MAQIDGESGHRLSLENSVVHAIVTPCSARSNNITVQLIQQVRDVRQAAVGVRCAASCGCSWRAAQLGVLPQCSWWRRCRLGSSSNLLITDGMS